MLGRVFRKEKRLFGKAQNGELEMGKQLRFGVIIGCLLYKPQRLQGPLTAKMQDANVSSLITPST